jgi:hypothetical protein
MTFFFDTEGVCYFYETSITETCLREECKYESSIALKAIVQVEL